VATENKTSRLDQTLARGDEGLLSVYFTAGYPNLDDTVTIIQSLEHAGADLIEIGIPFSDPLADGPTIQASNQVALENGMSVQVLFDQLSGLRDLVKLPIILMGYLNPILQYGIEAFAQRCQQVGIDALIIPDLPMQEYLLDYKQLFNKYGIYNIFLITPQTPEDRILEIDTNSQGFIYVVSSASVTGAKSAVSVQQKEYFRRINQMNLKTPTLIGFGISDHQSYRIACDHSSGAIIGSAFIDLISNSDHLTNDIHDFIKKIKGTV